MVLAGLMALLLGQGGPRQPTCPAVEFQWAHVGSSWDNSNHWTGGTSGEFPGSSLKNGDANIGNPVGATFWPQMQANRCICNLDMTASSQLDLNAKTLTVTGTATFDSTNRTNEPIKFTNTAGTAAYLNASSIVINGGSLGTRLEFGGSQITVQSGSYGSCP